MGASDRALQEADAVSGGRGLSLGGQGSHQQERAPPLPEAPGQFVRPHIFSWKHSMTQLDTWPPFQTQVCTILKCSKKTQLNDFKSCVLCVTPRAVCSAARHGRSCQVRGRNPRYVTMAIPRTVPEGWKPGSGRSFVVNSESCPQARPRTPCEAGDCPS